VLGIAAVAVSLAGLARAEPAASRGPFGITMGEPLSQLGKVDPVGGGGYMVLKPPIPNGDLEGVAVTSFPDLGVCRITAVSPRFEDDSSGRRVKQAADDLAEKLVPKYGPYTKKIVKCNDSGGCDDGWLSYVQSNQAEYVYAWNLEDKKRPDGVAIILVLAKAVDATTSQVHLTYYGFQEQACANEENASAGQGL